MFNDISLYVEAGEKAGTARKQRDEARAQFHRDWLRRALTLENEEDRVTARKAFDDAYRAVATPAVKYFR